jgi:hypothetical protein
MERGRRASHRGNLLGERQPHQVLAGWRQIADHNEGHFHAPSAAGGSILLGSTVFTVDELRISNVALSEAAASGALVGTPVVVLNSRSPSQNPEDEEPERNPKSQHHEPQALAQYPPVHGQQNEPGRNSEIPPGEQPRTQALIHRLFQRAIGHFSSS